MGQAATLTDIVNKITDWSNIPDNAVLAINLSSFSAIMLDPSCDPIIVEDRRIKERYDQLHDCKILIPSRPPRSKQDLHKRITSRWDVEKVHKLLEGAQ